MRQSRSRTTLILLLGPMVALALSLLVNHYFYSWIGVLANKVGLCECKQLYVPGQNGHPVNLSFLMNFDEASLALSSKTEYETIHNGTYLSVSRIYDGVRYSLTFDNYMSERRGNVTALNMNLFPHRSGEARAEKYSTPTHVITQHVFEMIDDLPATPEQKVEMRSKARVNCELDLNLPL